MQKSLSGPRGQKRSLLFIGHGDIVLSELFGTTSEADLNPIKEHIGRLAKGYNHLDKGLRMQRHHFSSFVEFTTERLDAIRNLTVIQQEAFKEFQDQFQQLYNNAGQNQQRLILAVSKMQSYFQHLREIDEFRQAVELLLQGIVTPQLVPKSTLRNTLMDIKAQV